ncbi:MAG: aldose 1-epimerase family protein [Solirubrobacteraceae bacterium]
MSQQTGEQHTIRRGEHRLCVTEVGAGLREYAVGAWQVLEGFAADEPCTGGRGQLLWPWPNRIAAGRYRFGGAEQQLALTEPAQQNAIHGLARWANWAVREREETMLEFALRLHAQPGWPWVLDLAVRYELVEDGLRVEARACNRSPEPCPYGFGAHPYLSVAPGRIDGATLQAPGARHLLSDERQIPNGAAPVAGTPLDFREPRTIGAAELDTAFGELRRDEDGLARVTLSGSGNRVVLWMDEAFPYLMLFTGDSLEERERRRTGLGVEPMTCAPNAFNSGDGLRTLQPGERTRAVWGITPYAGAA